MPGLFPLFKDYLPKLNLKVISLPRPEDVRSFSGQIAEKDAPVLVSAIQSKADFLVTGDKQHFGKMKGIGEYLFQITAVQIKGNLLRATLVSLGCWINFRRFRTQVSPLRRRDRRGRFFFCSNRETAIEAEPLSFRNKIGFSASFAPLR